MKRRVVAGTIGMILGLAIAPFVGCAVVSWIPSLAHEKFISEGDGSVGPAFYACLAIWGGLSVLSIIAGLAPIVVGALRRTAGRA